MKPRDICECMNVTRLPIRLEGDDRRVLALPFTSGAEWRVRKLIERADKFSDRQVQRVWNEVALHFATRHEDFESILLGHYEKASRLIDSTQDRSRERKLLIGSYCTMEYAIQSAALFNPSIVPHPVQDGTPEGAVRFVMSLRATGEGHVSSTVFHTGMIQADHSIHMDPPSQYTSHARISPDRTYFMDLFRGKLKEMNVNLDLADVALSLLGIEFTFAELEHAIEEARTRIAELAGLQEALEAALWLANSNYKLRLPPDDDISELVIFPQSVNEERGIEDMRLVQFSDNGDRRYFGTYTAFDGYRILPMLLETPDFHDIRIHTLNGACAQNKGMALFPRRVNGHYAMCSRIDGHSLYIMYSDIVHFWETTKLLASPKYPWELMLIGNCGSPIETSEGWLLITHGVGPMRRYCIGAMLLDLDKPTKVIGRLREPLIAPTEEEREGYTPNVVYSCGSMVHADHLFLPYAMSDTATGVASIELSALLDCLRASPG